MMDQRWMTRHNLILKGKVPEMMDQGTTKTHLTHLIWLEGSDMLPPDVRPGSSRSRGGFYNIVNWLI